MYKKYFENKKVIAFDLNGTIADTDSLWQQAFEKVLTAEGSSWPAWRPLMGQPIENRWDEFNHQHRFNKNLTLKELTSHTISALRNLSETSTLEARDGFWELAFELKELKKNKLALTSNAPKEAVKIILETLGIFQTFDIILCSDDVKNSKPSTDIYNKLFRDLTVTKEEVLVFEDSVLGALSSVNAGIDTIIIWNQEISKIEYPDRVKFFVNDFLPFVGNLDLTLEEHIKKAAQQMAEQRETLT